MAALNCNIQLAAEDKKDAPNVSEFAWKRKKLSTLDHSFEIVHDSACN